MGPQLIDLTSTSAQQAEDKAYRFAESQVFGGIVDRPWGTAVLWGEGGAIVVNLTVGRDIKRLDLPGLPHLGSGIAWTWNGRPVMATPHLKEGLLSVLDMQDWSLVASIKTKVHAIGPGAVIFEVQQNSDITYRLFDWGRNRTLHIEEGLRTARIEDGSKDQTVEPKMQKDGGVLLLENPFFRLRRYSIQWPLPLSTGGAFLIVTVIGGKGTLGWHSGGTDLPIKVKGGDSVLVPASVGEVFLSPIGGLDVVVTDPTRR